MTAFNMIAVAPIIFYYCCFASLVSAERDVDHTLVWCTVSVEEQLKCGNFSEAVQAATLATNSNAINSRTAYNLDNFTVMCKQAVSKDECISWIDNEVADITSLDGGEIFISGRYHSLVPIMQEMYEGGDAFYYSVAVIRKNTLKDVHSLFDFRNIKACFPRVGSLAGWVIPIETLMREGGLEIVDCNNHVKSAINYFGPSCAVNSLIDTYNPVGDNSEKLCELCRGPIPGGRCTPTDPYSDFHGALHCLADGAGEVAFLRHNTVLEMTKDNSQFLSLKANDFELVCKDGSRREVTDYQNCNWGKVVSDGLVISSAKSYEIRKKYQRFIQESVKLFSTNEASSSLMDRDNQPSNRYSYTSNSDASHIPSLNTSFKLFESEPKYGNKLDLLFQDRTVSFFPIEEDHQNFDPYLGKSLESILRVRRCTVNKMTLCVTSEQEYEKCRKMQIALKAQLLKPEMECFMARSHIDCMHAVNNKIADVVVLEAGDIYTAGLKFDMVPFVQEVYQLGLTEYYVVAVSKEEDPSTELTYLKGKNTCHTGMFTGAGWIIPLAYLISNNWIRTYGCDSVHAAAEYFQKSCVPGALSSEYVGSNTYDNLCHLCHGSSYKYCSRNAGEDYYGFTGAFRCLVEGGGDVAFIKHTTVYENADGKRKEWWARNALNEDFQLLCPDGTRADLKDFGRCNMGSVQANAIVTRGGSQYNETEINAYINLFVYAQQFYGRKDDADEFSLFVSNPPYSDLIFQDSAQQLRVIEADRRSYDRYLGEDFMRARRIVDCNSGAASNFRTPSQSFTSQHGIILLSLCFSFVIRLLLE